MIKIMIAEDNIAIHANYQKFLTNDKDIEIVANTFDGEQTLQRYLELKPDFLILDLDLPKKNGIEVLDKICEIPEEKKKCNVLVVSGRNDFRQKLYNTKKVYMSLEKPVDYNEILKVIKDYDKERLSCNELKENEIRQLLIKLHVTPYTKNANLLINATLKAYNTPSLLTNIKVLYFEVGKDANMDFTKVKWSIRNSIRTINRNIPSNISKEIFETNTNRETITPTIFFVKVIQYFENAKSHKD